MANGRAPTPENPDYVPIQPGAVPGSTFVQQGENPLMRLSQSLGELNPRLASFGHEYIANQQAKEKEQAVTKVPLMTNKEVEDAYKGGHLPGMTAPDSIADITSRKLYGERQADVAQNAMKEELAKGGFDWEKGNINDFVRGHMKTVAEPFANDPMALKGFLSSMDGFPQKLAALRTQQATALDQQKRQENTFQAISLAADKATEDGKTPAEIAQAVRAAQIATSGPGGSQGVPYGDSDKFVIQKAAQMVADGKNLDAAVALVTEKRTGPAGEQLPGLRDTPAHQEQINSILKQAASQRKKQAELALTQAVTAQDAGTILSEKGSLIGLKDVPLSTDDEGKPRLLTADKRQEAAATAYIQRVSPQYAAANRETPTQTFDRELSNLSLQGLPHPVWKETLEAAPKGASLNELSNPAKRDKLLASAHLYDNLREKNPLYLQSLVDSKSRDFFEVYRAAKTIPGNTMEQSLDMARRATQGNVAPEREDTLKGHYKEIEEKVRTATPQSGFWSFFSPTEMPVNAGYVQQQLIDKAKMYARLDLSPKEAIAAATKQIGETTTRVGSWVVPDMKTAIPSGFPAALDGYIKDFVGKYGKLNDGVSASDVGLSYNGAGTFTVVSRSGIGLRTPTGVASFTLKDLMKNSEAKVDNTRQQMLDNRKKFDDQTKLLRDIEQTYFP